MAYSTLKVPPLSTIVLRIQCPVNFGGDIRIKIIAMSCWEAAVLGKSHWEEHKKKWQFPFVSELIKPEGK